VGKPREIAFGNFGTNPFSKWNSFHPIVILHADLTSPAMSLPEIGRAVSHADRTALYVRCRLAPWFGAQRYRKELPGLSALPNLNALIV
jgi:hypothetical protein